MEISIKDAAELLGKSERTVRHMAQSGRLPARRVGSRWLIDREELQSGKYTSSGDDAEVEAELAAESTEDSEVTNAPAADETAASDDGPRPRFRFDRALPPGTPSVRALGSFHIAADLLAELGELRSGLRDAPLLAEAERHLRDSIEALADGCHADVRDQPERFRVARTQVCAALTDLIHFNVSRAQPDLTPLVDRIERELLGSLHALIGVADERRSWRFRARNAAEAAAARVLKGLRGLAGESRLGARLAALQERLVRSAPVAVH
jgi:excisionase family DNA binding protein